MKSNSQNILFNEDFLSRSVKDKSNVIVFGDNNQKLVKMLQKIDNKLNITKVKINGNNHNLLEKIIEYQQNQFDLCILNFPFNKNLEKILVELFNNITAFISLPVVKREYGICKFLRLCKKMRIGIVNISFYKKDKEISGFFAKYFADKVLITINKSVHSFVYEEEFIKRKLMKLVRLGKKIPAFSSFMGISKKNEIN